MKLLLITDDDGRGGSAAVTRQLAQELSSLHSVTVAYRFDEVSTRFFAFGSSSYGHLDSRLNQRAFRKSVHDHRSACRILAESGCEFIVFSDSMVFSSHLALKEAAHQAGIPYIVIVNIMHTAKLPWLKGEVERKSLETIAGAQATVFVSRANLAAFKNLYPECDARLTVIPNACERRFFTFTMDHAKRQELRASLGADSQSVMMLTAARVERVKGHNLVLSALAELRNETDHALSRLLYVAAGNPNETYLSSLRRQAAEAGIESHVRFLGHRQDIPDLIHASDVCILASYAEGMPLSIAEAMACGRPIIATSVSGIPEQLLPDFSWLLPDPNGSAAACVTELKSILARLYEDRGKLITMGEAARRHAISDFHPDTWSGRYARLIDSGLPGKSDVQEITSQHDRYVLRRGAEVACSDPRQSWCYLLDGWSGILDAGAVQAERQASLEIPFDPALASFKVQLRLLHPHPQHIARVTISLAGSPVATSVLDRNGTYTLDVAIDARGVPNPLVLSFETELSARSAVTAAENKEASARRLVLRWFSLA